MGAAVAQRLLEEGHRVLGVDLAVAPLDPIAGRDSGRGRGHDPGRSRSPARGGIVRELPGDRGGGRVTFLASGRAGWAALCRMVSATHLAGERGRPVATLDLLAPHLGGGDVLVLLGPTSELGAAATRPGCAPATGPAWGWRRG